MLAHVFMDYLPCCLQSFGIPVAAAVIAYVGKQGENVYSKVLNGFNVEEKI